MEASYWKTRCLAAEAVLQESTLKQSLRDRGASYQPEWYKAVAIWQELKKKYEQVRDTN